MHRQQAITPGSSLIAAVLAIAGLVLVGMVLAAAPLAAAPVAAAAPTPTLVNVLTFHNDNLRSGHNRHETILKVSNVTAKSFGKLFSYPVDGYLYAEPLYVSQLPIPGQGTRNVVFVASEHDSVYAFDADGAAPTLLWQKSFIDPANGITTVDTVNDIRCGNLVPEIGVTGTPVISLENQALYVVSEVKDQNTGSYNLELHALELATGAEKAGSPVSISASVAGTGAGNDGHGNVPFVARLANQRPALLLANGMVYIAFASNCDEGPYHGWLLAYDALTLMPKAAFNPTPNGNAGGIWQSGNGPSASQFGRIFIGIGNGTFDGTTDYGDSFVKLDPMLRVVDYFTPSNQDFLNNTDDDSGITGAVLLPDRTFEVMGGVKSGRFYLLSRGPMGRFCAACEDSQALGILDTGFGIFDAPAYAFGMVYIGGVGARLKAWQISNGRLAVFAAARSANTFGYPGASPAISSDGAISRIVWALDVSGFGKSLPAVLHAYWANNLAEIYNSAQASGSRDTAGPAVKFTVPTVANGKVYVGTQTELDVYGLLPPAP
ncbi:MAG: pyrrolo-quinoline quinone [Candidatus Binataceae bacterium]